MATGAVVGGGQIEDTSVKIVESGTTDGWSWKKYSDGTAEAVGEFARTIAINGSVGSGVPLKRTDSQTFDIPSGLFTKITYAGLFPHRDGDALIPAVMTTGTTTSIAGYAIIVATTGYASATIRFSWHLIGTWK